MSGPEWTPEQLDPSKPSRALSVESGNPGANPIVGANPFGAERARASSPTQVERDDHDAQANLEADELDEVQGPSKLSTLVATVRSAIVAGIGGLLARLRKQSPPELDEDAIADVSDAPSPSFPTDPEAAKPRRAPRWSPRSWSWETRVGMAAVFSFVILAGVFVLRKNRADSGKPAPPLQIGQNKPGDPKPEDSVGTKPPENTVSPPVPNLASKSTSPGRETGVSAAPRGAPGDTATARVSSSPGGVAATTDPQTPPNTHDLLAMATSGEPTVPPVLPGSGTDAPPLPPEPTGGAAPTNPPAADPQPTETSPTSEPATTTPPTTTPEPANSPPPATTLEPAATPPPATLPEPGSLPAVETAPPVTETPPPASTPKPAAAPEPPPEPVAVAAAPLEPASPRKLESVPPDAPAGAPAPGWVTLPSAGKRPGGSASADTSSPSEPTLRDEAPSRSRMAESPSSRDDAASAGSGPVATELHTVQADENFWTISKLYYNSHRYYRALAKANAAQVPDITKLYVGTVIRIPPPEALDRSLVESLPPGDGSALSRTSSSPAPKSADPGAEMAPTRSTRPGLLRARSKPATDAPRRPTYRVKAYDTLRSIARDTLDDPKRDGEIYSLNRDTLDDPKAKLAPGTTLTLPEDAVIGRRLR